MVEPTPGGIPASPSYALTTVAPLAPSVPARLVAPPLPAVINRETVTHGLIAVSGVAGVGALTLVAGSSTLGLVAAALAAGVTTAIAAVRFLGGGASQRQLLAHMQSERAALNAATDTITAQLSSLADDRRQLAADRAELASERQSVHQRAADEAQRIVAPVRAELDAERQKLAAERDALNTWVTAQNDPKLDATRLSADDLQAIAAAIGAYNVSTNNMPQRFVGELYTGGPSTAAQRMIPNERVVATLVGTGRVHAGAACMDPQSKFVVRADAATTITSIAQLREFLFLATGRRV